MSQSGPAWAQDVGVSTPLAAVVGQSVRLDPTDGFDDIKGAQLRPVWRWIDRPAVSVAGFDDVNALRPAVTIDVPGTYVAQLDLYADGDPVPRYATTVEISSENTAPVALIAMNGNPAPDGPLILDGASSYDVDGDALTYLWSVAEAPAGGSVRIDADDAPITSVSFDGQGRYALRLDVYDTKGGQAHPTYYSVDVDGSLQAGRNTAPTARLAFDQQSGDSGAQFGIDALRSTDIEGDMLTADISVIAATDANPAVSTRDGGRFLLTPDVGHDYLISARVGDGNTVSVDQMLITTNRSVGVRPVAKIAPVPAATPGAAMTLDGTQSYDFDGDALTYAWSVSHAPVGSKAVIEDGAMPAFTPDLAGAYVLQLIVSDGALASTPRTVVVSTDVAQLTANAGPDQITDGALPQLTQGWSVVQQITGIDGTSLNALQFVAATADVAIVGDGDLPPSAMSKAIDPVATGEMVRLMSTAVDPNGGPTNQRWSLLSKPVRSALTIPAADQTAPLVDIMPDVPGMYLVQLAADDGALAATPVVFAVTALNSAPTAQISADATGFVAEDHALDGRGSFDRDGDPLRFDWELVAAPAGSRVAITDANRPLARITPDVKGDYRIGLRVSDADLVTVQTFDFTVANRAPIAAMDGPATAIMGNDVRVTALGTTDPDGDVLTYSFEVTDPDGVVQTVASDDGALVFIPDLQGPYEITLTASDGEQDSQASLLMLAEAVNTAPVLDDLAATYTVELGLELALDVRATDADGDNISYFAGPLPMTGGMHLDAQTGALRFRPELGQIGQYSLIVGASDGRDTAQTDLTINVVAGNAGRTGIHGDVLAATQSGQGLSGIPVRLERAGLQTVTDASGRFSFGSLSAGPDTVVVNPVGADQTQAFMTESRAVQVIDDQDRDVAPAIYLTPLNEGCRTVVAGRDTVLTGPSGLQVTVAADTIRAIGGAPYDGQVCLGALPQNFAHPALPETVDACQIYGLSAPNAQFTSPFTVTVPNADGLPDGAVLDVLEMSRGGSAFAFSGEGMVTGGDVTASLYGEALFSLVPQAATIVRSGNMPTGNLQISGLNGDLIQTYALPTYMSSDAVQTLALRYRSVTADPVSIIAGDVTMPATNGLPVTLDSQLVLGGVQMTDGPVWNPRKGIDGQPGGDIALRQSMPVDVSGLPTGRYPYTFTSRAHYDCSSIATQYTGDAIVQNDTASPIGRGWSLQGLQRLTQTATGAVTIMQDDQIASFDPKNAITSFEDAPQVIPMSGVAGIDSGDFDGNGTTDIAVLREDGTKVVLSNTGRRAFEAQLASAREQMTEIADNTMQALGDRGILAGEDSKVVASLSTGQAQFDLLVADINGDGKKDVIFGRDDVLPADVDLGVDGDSYTFIGRGDGSLRMFAQDGAAATFSALDLVDVDGDGSVDLIAVEDGAVHIQYSTTGGAGMYVPRAGEFSRLIRLADSTWQRDLSDGTKIRFDAGGRMLSKVDGAGDGRAFSYDIDGQLIAMTDAAGRVTSFAYANGGLSTITTPDGRQTRLTHDAGSHALTGIIDPAGGRTTYQYDTSGHMIGAVNVDGHTTRFSFDAVGHLIRTARPDGTVQTMQAAATVGLTGAKPLPFVTQAASTFTDATGTTSEVTLNAFGSAIIETDALGRQTLTQRDANNLPLSVISPSSVTASQTRVDSFAHDVAGRLIQQTQAVGTPEERARSWHYDDMGRLVSETDWAGSETLFSYDDTGRMTQMTDAMGAVTIFGRTADGQIASQTDANGHTTAFDYDAAGNLAQVTGPNGVATVILRDTAGNVVEATDAAGTDVTRITTHRHDAMNRPTEVLVTDATGITVETTTFAYLPSGLIVAEASAAGDIRRVTYDAMGRVATEQSGAALTTYRYNAAGDVVAVSRTNGPDETYTYDDAGRLVVALGADGQTTYAYDLRDNPVRIDGPGGATTARFDALDRMISQTDALGHETARTFDVHSNITSVMTADNAEMTTRYDLLSRPVVIETADNTRSFGYDAVGNLLHALDDDSRVTMTYDAENRVKTATTDGFVGRQPDVVLTYDYDALGRRVQARDSLGGSTAFAYDAADRLISQTTPWGVTYTRGFDAAGHMSDLQASSGRASVMAYGPGGQTGLRHTHGGVVIADWTLDYAFDGVLTGLTDQVDPTRSLQMTHDDLGRVVQVSQGTPAIPVEDYAYNTAGQLIASHQSSRFAYDSLGQMTADDQYSYDYDLRGNVTTRQDLASGLAETFRYDGEDQLIGYASPNTSVGYAYDAFGRLIGRTTTDGEQAYVHDTACLTDCAIMTFEVASTPKLTQRWAYGADGMPMSLETYGRGSAGETGSSFELFFGPAATDLWVVDPVSSDIVAAFDYSAQGVLMGKQGKVDLLPHLFDQVSGLRIGSAGPQSITTGTLLQLAQ